MDEIQHHFEPWELMVRYGIYSGIVRKQGILGGAKWILSDIFWIKRPCHRLEQAFGGFSAAARAKVGASCSGPSNFGRALFRVLSLPCETTFCESLGMYSSLDSHSSVISPLIL